MTTLLLVRHGQSCANEADRFVGQTDSPLSKLGIIQAQKTAEYIAANYVVDKVYASDLSRAFQTGKATADKFGLEVIPEKDLREIFAGEWEDLSLEELFACGGEAFKVWESNIGRAVCPSGESIAAVQERAARAIDRIIGGNEGKTIVIASHATVIRSLQCLYEGKNLDEMKTVPWVTNASVTVVRCEKGKKILVTVGAAEHLQGMLTGGPLE